MLELRQIDAPTIAEACERITSELVVAHGEKESFFIVGVTNGGVDFGQRLAKMLSQSLGREIPVGQVNITYHRDDIGTNPIPAVKDMTDLPFDINDATIILADDVIASGRTIRAALNELFDNGRPARVELAVLCDRGGRRLPIEPNYLGLKEDADPDHKVRVTLDLENPEQDRIVVLQP